MNSIQLKKAYLISLCLSAKTVLAETSSEGQADEEKTMVNQVLEALLQPSAEHMQIYLGLGLVLAVISGLVYQSFREGEMKVTMEDFNDDKPARSKRAKVKRPEGAAEPQLHNGPPPGMAMFNDNGIDYDALHKQLDEQAPWPKTISGSLEPEDALKLMKIIADNAYVTYNPIRQKLINERLNHLQFKREKEYAQCVARTMKEFQGIQNEVAMASGNFLGLNEAQF